jgi:hypothetical protein
MLGIAVVLIAVVVVTTTLLFPDIQKSRRYYRLSGLTYRRALPLNPEYFLEHIAANYR